MVTSLSAKTADVLNPLYEPFSVVEVDALPIIIITVITEGSFEAGLYRRR